MSTNKNALIRYKILDSCFRNPGKKYFIDTLIEECEKVLLEIDPDSNGISRRQIFDDINFMKSADGWDIELDSLREGKKVYYRYKDTDFSINNMPFNEFEINQLKTTLVTLSQFKGMPQFEWINELIVKLRQGISQDENTTIIEFDNNQYLKGIEHLGTLHNAIFNKTILKITYQPFEFDKPYQILIHPYYLKQYNNRWFLFGYNPEKEKSDWNMALDRIKDIKEVKGRYKQNNEIDWVDYFEDIIGVTKPENKKTENIVLHFYGKTTHYVETKPLHGSQKSKRIDDNTLEVRLNVMINYELERLIISYADSVKIISPASLVKHIKSRLSNSLVQYEK